MQIVQCDKTGAAPQSAAVINPQQQQQQRPGPVDTSNERGQAATLYVHLFHGRKDPKVLMDDWGTEGPTFGPYKYVHTTYGLHIKMGRPDGDIDSLFYHADLIFYDGVFYGDASVFTAQDRGGIETWCQFEQSKARQENSDSTPPASGTTDTQAMDEARRNTKIKARSLAAAVETFIDAHLNSDRPTDGGYDAADQDLRKALMEDEGEHFADALRVVMQRILKINPELDRLRKGSMAIFAVLGEMMDALEAQRQLHSSDDGR